MYGIKFSWIREDIRTKKPPPKHKTKQTLKRLLRGVIMKKIQKRNIELKEN